MTLQSNLNSWQPPDGLGYSSLRPVRLTKSGIALVLLGVFFVGGGPVLSYYVAQRTRHAEAREQMLAQQGVETAAVITRLWRTGDNNENHMVAYRFTAEDRNWTNKVTAPRQTWSELHDGGSLAVRYVPGRPAVNHPAAWRSSHAPNWVPWLVLAASLGPASLLWCVVRRQARLLSEGRPAPGTVTRLKRSDKQMIAYYDFTLLSGQVVKGRSNASGRLPGVGSQVCVLYLPDNPRRNALYPLKLVRLG